MPIFVETNSALRFTGMGPKLSHNGRPRSIELIMEAEKVTRTKYILRLSHRNADGKAKENVRIKLLARVNSNTSSAVDGNGYYVLRVQFVCFCIHFSNNSAGTL